MVTFKDKSVPPDKKLEFGYFLIIFFKSFIVLGEKYFLFSLATTMFFEFIFFKRPIIFFLFLLNLSILLILFKLFAASTIGLYPVQRHKFPEIESLIISSLKLT